MPPGCAGNGQRQEMQRDLSERFAPERRIERLDANFEPDNGKLSRRQANFHAAAL